MGYYCTVPQCTSLAGKTKNVKFHRFPRDKTMAEKWNIILKRGKPITQYSKVCSLHFTQADYNVTTMGQWKTLSKDAMPSQNLPRLNPDGTVMVIRKSRTLKTRDPKKDDGEHENKWGPMAPTPAHAGILETTVNEGHDAHLAYRLQTLNTLANAVSPLQQNQSQTNETLGPNGTRSLSQGSNANGSISSNSSPGTSQNQSSNPGLVRPKKQDAIMQTDPVQEDNEQLNNSYESSEKSYGSEQMDSFSQNQVQKEQIDSEYPSDKQKYDSPKDYTKTSDDYIPQTNDEYNKEAEKYALERKSHTSYDKLEPGYHKSVVEYGMRYDEQKYRDGYMSYQNGYPATAELLRQQQVNMQMLQESHRPHEIAFNEKLIKREDEDEVKYSRYKESEETDSLSPLYERRTHQQRLLEHLQHQLKQEPDQNAHETVMQPQISPYYQTNGHSDVSAGYYEPPLSRPGPELLIAKQNALAAHTQLWQNTMKRPFFYSENPQLLHRYEDFSRVLQ